jgi:hypothetical protein
MLDLKAYCWGHKYVAETLKWLAQMPEPILMARVFEGFTAGEDSFSSHPPLTPRDLARVLYSRQIVSQGMGSATQFPSLCPQAKVLEIHQSPTSEFLCNQNTNRKKMNFLKALKNGQTTSLHSRISRNTSKWLPKVCMKFDFI